MAYDQSHPPSAACLSASMRDLGYSLETAIADLIDNSISAAADSINIICDMSGADPVVIVFDNGNGMTHSELIRAMRHGTENPLQHRSPKDLGRFGLGLKTASFSQCRSLTVVSIKDNSICGAEWNLDRINNADDWILSILDTSDIEALPYIKNLKSHGTAVIWRKLDRLFEDESGHRRDEIVNEKLETVNRHLSLVFHRFMSGEIKDQPRISISINGHLLKAFDPFCRKNPATQLLPEEIVRIGDAEVRIQPYILPHHSRLSVSEYDYYQDRSDFISNQGGYVYRNGRLMAWGDWFRLVPKGEATKLARVQIDFPNSLDEEWTIDIKKSRARPPLIIREHLRRIINKVTSRSVTVHRGRGQKLFLEEQEPLWERYADQKGINFVINKNHPLVTIIQTKLSPENSLLNVLIDAISSSIPLEMIYSDYSTSPREINKKNLDKNQMRDEIRKIWGAIYGNSKGDLETFFKIARSTHIFDGHLDLLDKIIKEEFS